MAAFAGRQLVNPTRAPPAAVTPPGNRRANSQCQCPSSARCRCRCRAHSVVNGLAVAPIERLVVIGYRCTHGVHVLITAGRSADVIRRPLIPTTRWNSLKKSRIARPPKKGLAAVWHAKHHLGMGNPVKPRQCTRGAITGVYAGLLTSNRA
jgi:hypothetical protein